MCRDRIILDLCGGSGAWSRPYADAGYDVRLVTLPGLDVRTYIPPTQVYGILAAPPCGEFSIAKGSQVRDFAGALEIVDACLRIVRACQLSSDVAFWCMENPRGLLRRFLGKPGLSVHFWWYGCDMDKPTDLWGYFNPPQRLYSEPPGLFRLIQDVSNFTGRAADERAVTPPGFAEAFFKANR